MKKFKKLKLMAVIGLGLILAYATNVFASGSASLTIEGNSTVALNENITVNLLWKRGYKNGRSIYGRRFQKWNNI